MTDTAFDGPIGEYPDTFTRADCSLGTTWVNVKGEPMSLPLSRDATLGELFAKYGTDKGSAPAEDWMWGQGYERVYEPLLDPIRHTPVRFLELGWGEWDPISKSHNSPDNGGRSARAWHDYFTHPDSQIVAVDITVKNFPDAAQYPRVTLYDGTDATNPGDMGVIAQRHGPFDVIVDDASHVSSLTVASFKLLWPHVKPGGLYVVEDLHSSYHSYFFGKDEAEPNPNVPGPTAMNFFKRIADEAFFEGQRMKGPAVDGDPRSWDCFPRRYWMGYAVESITFAAPQIIVIRKRTEDRMPPDTPLKPIHPR